MKKCVAIEIVEKSGNGYTLLLVRFDDGSEAYWYYDYADSLQYINQDVIVEFRKDVYNGELREFIKTFTVPTVVRTLDKQDNIKLYIESVDNNSNLSFNEIQPGETRSGAIVYCISCEFKSSPNAVWQEFIIRDKSMHVAKLRLFDYNNESANFAGTYIVTDLSRNKYGFQTDMVAPVTGTMMENPEITVAEQFVRNYFAEDTVALSYIAETHLFELMRDHVDYEKGYAIVRMASELAMVDSLKNITKDVDIVSIGQAILCSYGHYTRSSHLSNSVNNITLMLRFQFPDRVLVGQLLDTALEDKPKEYPIYSNIQNTVAALLEIRKGTQM